MHLQVVSLVAFVVLCLLSYVRAKEEVREGPALRLISFHDTAETSKFEEATEWLKQKNCPISESINETYIKFLVANMTEEHGTFPVKANTVRSQGAGGQEG